MKKAFSTVLLLLLLTVFSIPGSASMDTQTVVMMISDQDEKAAGGDLDVYPSNEVYGAWVFASERERKSSDDTYKGSFWFVNSETATLLGSGSNIRDYNLYRGEQELFVCSYGNKNHPVCQAAVLMGDGPMKIRGAEKFRTIERYNKCIYGILSKSDDYCFLTIDGNRFYEVIPVELMQEDIDESRYAGDFRKVRREIIDSYPDASVVSYLYYDTGAMAVNFKSDGEKYHIYVFRDSDGPVIIDDWFGFSAADGYVSGNAVTSLPKYYSDTI